MRRLLPLLLVLLSIPSLASAASLGAILTGAAVPNGDPDAQGLADITIRGLTLEYAVTVKNISGPGIPEIRIGTRGQVGPLLLPLRPFVGHIAIGQMELDEPTVEALLEDPSSLYLIVPSNAHPAGALRGQLEHSLFLPVVGKAAGAAGTNFITQLTLVNLALRSTTGSAVFYPQSATGKVDPVVIPIPSVAGDGQLIMGDLLARSTEGIGALKVLLDQPAVVEARILNDLTALGRGTTGFSTKAKGLDIAKSEAVFPYLISASDQDIAAGIGSRTNLGYFNPHLYEVSLTLTALANDGAPLGEVTLNVPPGAMVQAPVFSIIHTVPESARVRASYFVRWHANFPMYVYASVVDNRTGDAVFVD